MKSVSYIILAVIMFLPFMLLFAIDNIFVGFVIIAYGYFLYRLSKTSKTYKRILISIYKEFYRYTH